MVRFNYSTAVPACTPAEICENEAENERKWGEWKSKDGNPLPSLLLFSASQIDERRRGNYNHMNSRKFNHIRSLT